MRLRDRMLSRVGEEIAFPGTDRMPDSEEGNIAVRRSGDDGADRVGGRAFGENGRVQRRRRENRCLYCTRPPSRARSVRQNRPRTSEQPFE